MSEIPSSLKLQPVPLNKDDKDWESNTSLHSSSNDKPLTLQPQIQHAKDGSLTTDDLWSMWNVATKAKSSIAQGQRLENLSWRLWYSTTAKHQHNQENVKGKKTTTLLDPALATTCSSILREIQQASSTIIHRMAHSVNSNPDDAATIDKDSFPGEMPASPPASPGIPIVTPPSTLGGRVKNGPLNNYLARKKKKNIERYMKRQQQKRLVNIDEEEHSENESLSLVIDQEVQSLINGHQPNSASSSATGNSTDTIEHPSTDCDGLFTGKRFNDDSSLSPCERKPSLLTMLLSRLASHSRTTNHVGCSIHTDQIPSRPSAPPPDHECVKNAGQSQFESFVDLSSLDEEFLDCCEIGGEEKRCS